MSEPKRPGKYVGHGTFVGYLCGEADAYMDHLEAELTQLRTEREQLLEYLGRIRPLAKSIAMISEADQDAKDMADSIWTITIAALTQREPRGQQIWPPVVDSANDSREGGDDE